MIMIIRKDGVVGIELTCSVVPGEQELFILLIQMWFKSRSAAKGNIWSFTKGGPALTAAEGSLQSLLFRWFSLILTDFDLIEVLRTSPLWRRRSGGKSTDLSRSIYLSLSLLTMAIGHHQHHCHHHDHLHEKIQSWTFAFRLESLDRQRWCSRFFNHPEYFCNSQFWT